MHVLKSTSLIAAVVSSMLMLSACGGGGSSKPASSNTAGTSASGSPQAAPPPVALPTTTVSLVFDGRITDTNQPVTTLLQADGSYFQVYSDTTVVGAPAGVILGAGALSNGSFSSANALDLNLVGTGAQTPVQANVTATYREGQSFNGTVTYANSAKAPAAFSGAYNNTYSTLPTLASLAGVYTGSIATKDVREDNIKLTVASDGTLTGQISCGCTITASLAPRSDRTSYVATLAFTGGDHPLSNKSIGGNVYLDAVKKRLYIIGKLGGTGDGAIFVGTKP
jgi:hypothetical protein